MTQTIRDAIAKLDDELTQASRRIATKREVYSLLPPDMPYPTLSNEDTKFFDRPGAWLSFSSPPYDPNNTWNPVRVLEQIEVSGFLPLPTTLCKWNDYRRTPEPGRQSDIPDEKGRYKLTTSEPIVPLWLEGNNNTGWDARAFYAYNGRVFKVSVDVRYGGVQLRCRRIEGLGEWRYDTATARLDYYPSLNRLEVDGVAIGGESNHTRAYAYGQGLDGVMYWEHWVEQDDMPVPSKILRAVLESN